MTRTRTIFEIALTISAVAVITLLVCQFIELVHTEHSLHRAALAGATEAALPRATQQSVRVAVRNAISSSELQTAADQPLVSVNARPLLFNEFEPLRSGDVVEVTLGAWSVDLVPDLLRPIGISLAGHRLRVTATVTKP